MSMVHKCDICGEIYGDYPVGDEKFAGISIRSAKLGLQNIFSQDEFDCCPKCTEELIRFIDILKTYPTRYLIQITDEEV